MTPTPAPGADDLAGVPPVPTAALARRGQATIHESGYRRYEGERLETRASVVATARYALERILGIRRLARSKIVPWGLAVGALLPALGFSAIVLLVPSGFNDALSEAGLFPGPEAYLSFVYLLLYIAAAIAGPSALCDDRRTGLIALYWASPLTRDTYLFGKALAVYAYLGMIAIVPPMIYLLGTMLAGAGPSGTGIPIDVGATLASGIVLAGSLGGLSIAAASLTERTTAANGAVVLLLMASGIIVNTVVSALGLGDGWRLLDLNVAVNQATFAFHDTEDLLIVHPVVAIGAGIAWSVGLYAIARQRFQRLTVSR